MQRDCILSTCIHICLPSMTFREIQAGKHENYRTRLYAEANCLESNAVEKRDH